MGSWCCGLIALLSSCLVAFQPSCLCFFVVCTLVFGFVSLPLSVGSCALVLTPMAVFLLSFCPWSLVRCLWFVVSDRLPFVFDHSSCVLGLQPSTVCLFVVRPWSLVCCMCSFCLVSLAVGRLSSVCCPWQLVVGHWSFVVDTLPFLPLVICCVSFVFGRCLSGTLPVFRCLLVVRQWSLACCLLLLVLLCVRRPSYRGAWNHDRHDARDTPTLQPVLSCVPRAPQSPVSVIGGDWLGSRQW